MRPDQLVKWINWILLPAIGSVSLIIVLLVITIYGHGSDQFSFSSEQFTSHGEPEANIIEPEIVDGVHLTTGLLNGEGLPAVINNCTNCHSAKLITQNRMSSERWRQTIHWMQRTQNLWDLGAQEEVIISYLSTNYAPVVKGRRQQLTDIDWYRLEIE